MLWGCMGAGLTLPRQACKLIRFPFKKTGVFVVPFVHVSFGGVCMRLRLEGFVGLRPDLRLMLCLGPRVPLKGHLDVVSLMSGQLMGLGFRV